MHASPSRACCEVAGTAEERDVTPTTTDVRTRQLGVGAAVATTVVLWGSAFVAIRVGLRGYGPIELAAGRYLVASALFAVVLGATRPRLPRRAHLPRIAVLGVTGFGLYNFALNAGEQTVTAGAAAFIVGIVPLLTALLAAMFLREKMRSRLVLGLLMSFGGSSLIALGEGEGVRFESGTILLLVAAASLALYFVLQKPLLADFRGLELTAYAVWAGTLFMLPASLELPSQIANAPIEATLAMVFLGVFPGAVAYVTWAYALARRPAAQLAQYLYGAPLISAVLGFVLIGETLPLLALAGGVLTLAGVIVGQWPQKAMASTSQQSSSGSHPLRRRS
jgi:drug/metabolite transporter (DMT)-like permease